MGLYGQNLLEAAPMLLAGEACWQLLAIRIACGLFIGAQVMKKISGGPSPTPPCRGRNDRLLD